MTALLAGEWAPECDDDQMREDFRAELRNNGLTVDDSDKEELKQFLLDLQTPEESEEEFAPKEWDSDDPDCDKRKGRHGKRGKKGKQGSGFFSVHNFDMWLAFLILGLSVGLITCLWCRGAKKSTHEIVATGEVSESLPEDAVVKPTAGTGTTSRGGEVDVEDPVLPETVAVKTPQGDERIII